MAKMKKPKKAHVLVSRDDVVFMRQSRFEFTPIEQKSAAKCRAAARELAAVTKCTMTALDAVMTGIPEALVQAYCKRRLSAR